MIRFSKRTRKYRKSYGFSGISVFYQLSNRRGNVKEVYILVQFPYSV